VREAVILSAVRTPVGKHGGSLAQVRPDDLGAIALKAAVERAGIVANDVADVYFGCANQAGEDNRNVARMSALLAGFPVTVPGVTVNRLCGSGLDALNQAAKSVMVGEGEVFLAGGVESMSRAPYALPKVDRAYPTGTQTLYDTTLGWRFVNPRMRDLYGIEAMGETAENLAEEYAVTREEQDRFALASHRKAVEAQDAGRFGSEIVPVEVAGRKGSTFVGADEGPRRDTSLEALAALKPAFRQDGTVTAGNSSSLNDGASALVVASADYARAHGLRVMARVLGFATAGVSPRVMGIGPVPATRKTLERSGVTLADLRHLELNEAFAAQSLAVLRDLALDPEDERLNPNGGAIALGHALGSSGSRLATTMLHELGRRGGGLGLATMCIGVGQGIATLLEVTDGR
jgi:3-oxoadipyl-CoA thiolase